MNRVELVGDRLLGSRPGGFWSRESISRVAGVSGAWVTVGVGGAAVRVTVGRGWARLDWSWVSRREVRSCCCWSRRPGMLEYFVFHKFRESRRAR